MKKYDFYSGLFFTVLSFATCILAYRFGLGEIHNPGPGLLPFAIASLLVFMSIGLLLRTLLGNISERQEKEVLQRIRRGRVILVLCALLGYGIAFNFLGFHLCTFLLMILLLSVVGGRKWWLTITISLIITFCTYLIFEAWLGCAFPRGTFWDLIRRS